MNKILVLDNYDSFTYNLVHYIEKILDRNITVKRNDEISLEKVNEFDTIILSPGPGLPDDAGILKDVIKTYAPTKNILGVCLGLQAIGECFGASLKNLTEVFHGVSTPMYVVKKDEILFNDIPKTFEAGRYHSWVIDRNTLPDCLEITCEDDEHEIMAARHKEYNVRGVQFHPESVLTEKGLKMIENFLRSCN